jgi:hypothetical protein
MPEWREHGLLAFTLNLQGGSPYGYSHEQPWRNSAFNPDGSLRDDYFARLERILDRADELGMVVILGYFYQGQDHVLTNETAVIRAVDNATDWILDHGYRNVIVEINNECDQHYVNEILRPERVHELIARVRDTERNGFHLLASTSYSGPLPNGKCGDERRFYPGAWQRRESSRRVSLTPSAKSARCAKSQSRFFSTKTTITISTSRRIILWLPWASTRRGDILITVGKAKVSTKVSRACRLIGRLTANANANFSSLFPKWPGQIPPPIKNEFEINLHEITHFENVGAGRHLRQSRFFS